MVRIGVIAVPAEAAVLLGMGPAYGRVEFAKTRSRNLLQA